VVQIGSSLPSSSFHPWLAGLLTSTMDMWAGSLDQGIHEEADTRDLVHLFHALQSSSLEMQILLCTDIVIIHLSYFHHIRALNLAAEIWTSLKAEKTTKMISLNTITKNLGTTVCKAMHGPFLRIHWIRKYFFHVQGKRSCCMLMHSAIFNYC